MRKKKQKTKWVAQARWRENNPEKSIACSKSWRDRHPGWYRGRNYVRLLENALVKGLGDAKVFKDSGMTWDDWIEKAPAINPGAITLLRDGWKLAPLRSWREFDLDDKEQVKAFLAPDNFKLVQK